MDCKFKAGVSSMCSRGLVTATILRQKIKDTLCVRQQSMQYHSHVCYQSLIHLLLSIRFEVFTSVKI
jgi:hypothetical protein